ncbi:MAG TPA: hypothetical protein VFU05_09555 [Cyclobacteriaceae bacterium]|nr:hypothetical protein [Cyclobacteriaceae bacterium]
MKAFTTIGLLLIATCLVQAQAVEEMKLPWKPGQQINLNLKFAERITVESWDKKEIYVKAVVTINDGTLNHAHVMDSTISDQDISILADLDEAVVGKNFWCNCEREGSWRHNIQNKETHKWVCTEIYYTVYLPAGADLELKTISGNIAITNMKGTIEAESVSGTVEVVIPAGSKADVRMKSVMGRVYSNPNLTVDTKYDGLIPILARKLNGKLNGGGKSVRLESVTGDVKLKSVQ